MTIKHVVPPSLLQLGWSLKLKPSITQWLGATVDFQTLREAHEPFLAACATLRSQRREWKSEKSIELDPPKTKIIMFHVFKSLISRNCSKAKVMYNSTQSQQSMLTIPKLVITEPMCPNQILIENVEIWTMASDMIINIITSVVEFRSTWRWRIRAFWPSLGWWICFPHSLPGERIIS